MKVETHILVFNEADILPYTLRHYATFCSSMVVHDLGSTDGSQAIAEKAGAVVIQHDCKGEFDDRLNKQIKQDSWKGSAADWIIQADADELLYFPWGAETTLQSYLSQKILVPKPHGFEMFSEEFPTGPGQLYDYVKHGGRDDKWYAKPVLFHAPSIRHMEFSTGAHTVEVTLKTGHRLPDPKTPALPPVYLLHCHHLGPIERIAKRYDENRARQSAINKQMRWGNQKPGLVHAQEKRALIKASYQRVIA